MGTKSNVIEVLIKGKYEQRDAWKTPELINKVYVVNFFPVPRKVSSEFIN